MVSLTYACASWEHVGTPLTFPTAITASNTTPKANSYGSLVVTASGSQTRVTDLGRNFAVEVNYNVTPLTGFGGLDADQVIQGYRRGKCEVTVSLDVEAETAGTHAWYDIATTAGQTPRQLTVTLNALAGYALALYFPSLYLTEVPKQKDLDGLNFIPITLKACNADSASTALARSNMRLGIG